MDGWSEYGWMIKINAFLMSLSEEVYQKKFDFSPSPTTWFTSLTPTFQHHSCHWWSMSRSDLCSPMCMRSLWYWSQSNYLFIIWEKVEQSLHENLFYEEKSFPLNILRSWFYFETGSSLFGLSEGYSEMFENSEKT